MRLATDSPQLMNTPSAEDQVLGPSYGYSTLSSAPKTVASFPAPSRLCTCLQSDMVLTDFPHVHHCLRSSPLPALALLVSTRQPSSASAHTNLFWWLHAHEMHPSFSSTTLYGMSPAIALPHMLGHHMPASTPIAPDNSSALWCSTSMTRWKSGRPWSVLLESCGIVIHKFALFYF